MKKYMTYAVIAFFATNAISFASPDKDAIMTKEKAAWEAFKDKKADDFKKMVSSDMRALYAEGVFNTQDELGAMQKWDIKSFSLSDYSAVAAGSDVMVTTYKVTIEGTYDGKDMSGTYNDGTVWKMEKGKWIAIFHTNIKAETGGTSAASPTP